MGIDHVDLGCTTERKAHSNVVVEVREVTKGGMVLTSGNRDTEHCYLDFLKNNGLLGNEEDTRDRYYTGYKLRDLFFTFTTSGKALTGEPGGGKDPFIKESEIGAKEDIAETWYGALMLSLPIKYRAIIRSICIENPARFDVDYTAYGKALSAREALDALYGAFSRTKDHAENYKKACGEQ